MNDEVTSITIRLPKSLRARLKKMAKEQERTESQLVRYYLNQLTQNNGKKTVA